MITTLIIILILLSLAPGGRQALQPVTVWPGDQRPISAAAAGQRQQGSTRAGDRIPGPGPGALYFFCSFYPGQILARSWRRPLDLTFIFFPPGCAWPGRGVHAPILLSKVKMLALQIFKVSKVSKVSNLNNKTGEIIR